VDKNLRHDQCDAIAAAAEAKVDANRLRFAPSLRQVTPGQAAQLAALAPPESYASPCAASAANEKWMKSAEFSSRIYFQTDVEDLRELKIPAHIKVLRSCALAARRQTPCLAGCCSRTVERHRRNWPIGAGPRTRAPDESSSPEGCRRKTSVKRSKRCGRSAVDVSSGVEDVPGVEDPEKSTNCAVRARAAATLLEQDTLNSPLRTASAQDAAHPTQKADTVHLVGATCRRLLERG